MIAANGKTGRRLVPLLEARGVAVRCESRSGSPAIDWAEPAMWGPALDGMDAAYAAYTPDLAVPCAPEDLTRFVEVYKVTGPDLLNDTDVAQQLSKATRWEIRYAL